MKNLLIVTDLSFPSGSAMASRIVSFCHLFNDIGYKVHVITGKSEEKFVSKFDYFTYEVVSSNRSYRLQSYIGNENLAIAVDDYLCKNDVDVVFTTSLNANFKKVFDVVKKYNKKIFVEQCEWYDPSSFRFGKYDIRYKTFIKNVTKNYLNVDGIISISRLLNDYYNNLGIKSIIIPSILDVKNKPFNGELKNKKIKLVYTGNASKSKELLRPILEAIKEYKDYFEFDIYGLNEDKLINNIDNDRNLFESVKDVVRAHGHVPQNDIEGILFNSDFQIFIRPFRKSSNAGFPTKLCESMSVGTPVISNDTGDICLYLKDGINGYISNGLEAKDIIDVFKIIIENKKSLRLNARKTAEENFDYRNYTVVIKDFIERL